MIPLAITTALVLLMSVVIVIAIWLNPLELEDEAEILAVWEDPESQ